MSAIIFDLDDTLHRERRWVMSGFSALACHLEQSLGLDARDVFRRLVASLRAGRRHAALQALCVDLDLPEESIPNWVAIIRLHQPRLRLPASTISTLQDLRSTWRLVVLTNGLPAVQARKVRALGVEPLVDAVVYAGHYGGGKPEARPFLEAAARVATHPARCVFVGDDPWCDIYGAGAVGMRTIRIRCHADRASEPACDADAVVTRLDQVSGIAGQLLQEEKSRVALDLRAHR